MDEKKTYYIQLPDHSEGEIWDEEKLARNREKLTAKYPDAIIRDGEKYDGGDFMDDDRFSVHLPDHAESEVWDGAKFRRNRAKLLAKYPDAEISRYVTPDSGEDLNFNDEPENASTKMSFKDAKRKGSELYGEFLEKQKAPTVKAEDAATETEIEQANWNEALTKYKLRGAYNPMQDYRDGFAGMRKAAMTPETIAGKSQQLSMASYDNIPDNERIYAKARNITQKAELADVMQASEIAAKKAENERSRLPGFLQGWSNAVKENRLGLRQLAGELATAVGLNNDITPERDALGLLVNFLSQKEHVNAIMGGDKADLKKPSAEEVLAALDVTIKDEDGNYKTVPFYEVEAQKSYDSMGWLEKLADKSKRKEIADKYAKDKAMYDTLKEYLAANGNDVEKALDALEKKAGAGKLSRREFLTREIAKETASLPETSGLGAWIGGLVPMVGTMAAGAGAATLGRAAAQAVGKASMASFAAGMAGNAMNQARMYGASDEDTWAAGLAAAGIMYAAGKIPYNRFTNRVFSSASGSVSRQLSKGLSDPNSPISKEAELLWQNFRKQFGTEQLFSKEHFRQWLSDMAASGTSFGVMGALEQMVPMIYAKPEDYPEFNQIFQAAMHGFIDGIAIGGVGGAAAIKARHDVNLRRWNAQGGIMYAQLDNGALAEIVGAREPGAKGGMINLPRIDKAAQESVTAMGNGGIFVGEKPGAVGIASWAEPYAKGGLFLKTPQMPDGLVDFSPRGDLIYTVLLDGKLVEVSGAQLASRARSFTIRPTEKISKAYLDMLKDAAIDDAEFQEDGGVAQAVADKAMQDSESRLNDAGKARVTDDEIIFGGLTPEQTGAGVDYVTSKAVSDEIRSERRNQMWDIISESIGKKFWRGDEGDGGGTPPPPGAAGALLKKPANGKVSVIQYTDGRELLVVGEDNAEYSVVDTEGNSSLLPKVQVAADIAAGKAGAHEHTIDEYLDFKIAEQDMIAEQERMNRELSENLTAIVEKVNAERRINIGTPEAESWVEVKGIDPTLEGGIIVVGEDGEQTMGWQQVADALNMPLLPKNNQQIATDQVNAAKDAREEILKSNNPEEEAAPVAEEAPAKTDVFTDPVANELGIPEDYAVRDEQDGTVSVNINKLWTERPDLLAKYNDQTGALGMSTLEFLQAKKAVVDNDIAKQDVLYKQEMLGAMRQDKIKAISAERARLVERGKQIADIMAPYQVAAQMAAEAQAETAKEVQKQAEIAQQQAAAVEESTAVGRIPKDDKGNMLFEKAEVGDSAAALIELANGNINSAIETAEKMVSISKEKAQKARKSPVKGTNPVEIINNTRDKEAKVAELDKVTEYWADVTKNLTDERARSYKKENDTTLYEPQTLEEVVANAINDLPLQSLDKESFAKETGWGNKELRSFFPWWAKKGQGMSLQKLAEQIGHEDTSGLVPQMGEAEQADTQAIRDAILSVLHEVSKPSDLKTYTRDRNLERRAEEEAYYEGLEEYEKEKGQYQLSDEVDENGRQFVLTTDGKLAFGEITADTGLVSAPILLSEGVITNPATNDGYGLVHIEARHGDEIRKAGYESVIKFIEEVAKNYQVIRKGKERDGLQTYMLQLTDKHNNTLMVELSGDGSYWNINTAGIFKTTYGAKNDIVYNRPTSVKQPAETVEATQSDELNGTRSDSSGYTTTTQPSESKGTNNSEKTIASEEIPDETPLQEEIAQAEAEVNTEPTEAQKQAGNYKMGHVTIDGFDVTIENPKGSVRRGVSADGKEWETKMNNTYGYIRGTEGVDGDHIDVFLSDNPEQGNVFVVDQIDPKTGKFDEHKVMYGFGSADEARNAYLSNYEEGWQGLGTITEVTKEEFKKWVDSSHRKTKPFSEYKSVSPEVEDMPEDIFEAPKTEPVEDALIKEINDLSSQIDSMDAELKQMYEKAVSEKGEDSTKDSRLQMISERSRAKTKLIKLMQGVTDSQLSDLLLSKNESIVDAAKTEEKNRNDLRFFAAVSSGVADAQQVPSVSAKAVSKINPYDYVGKDETRPVLQGVFHDSGYAVASDAQILISDAALYEKKNEGKIIGKNDNKISGLYPRWRDLIPGEGETNVERMDFGRLRNFLAGVKAAREAEWTRLKAEGKKVGSKSNYVGDARVLLNIGDNQIIGFKYSVLSKLADFAEHIGAKELQYVDDRRGVAVQTKKGIGLAMPVMTRKGEHVGLPVEEVVSDYIDRGWYSYGENAVQKAMKQRAAQDAAFSLLGITREKAMADRLDGKLSEIDNRLKETRSRGELTPNTYDALMDEKTAAIKEFVEENISDPNHDCVVTPRKNLAEAMAGAGVPLKEISWTISDYNAAAAQGIRPRGFRVKNGTIFMITDNILDSNDAKSAHTHEEEHNITVANGDHVWLAGIADRNNLLNAIDQWAGYVPQYHDLSDKGVANEFISMAIEKTEGLSDSESANVLHKAGINNEEIINFVKNRRNEREDRKYSYYAGRDQLAAERPGSNIAEGGRDSQPLSDRILGREGNGSAAPSGGGVESGRQVARARGALEPLSVRDLNPEQRDQVRSLDRDGVPAPKVIEDINEASEGTALFSLDKEKKSLVGIHNIASYQLLKALRLGGLANPSAAVIDLNYQNHFAYGDISLVMPSRLVDSRTGRNAGTFTGDAYTPEFPTITFFETKESKQRLAELLNGLPDELSRHIHYLVGEYVNGDTYGSGLEYIFLKEKGIDLGIQSTPRQYPDASLEEFLTKYLKAPEDLDYMNYDALMNAYGALSEDEKVLANYYVWSSGNKHDMQAHAERMEKYPKLKGHYTDDIGFGRLNQFCYDLQRDQRNAGKEDIPRTVEVARNYVSEQAYSDEFNSWLDKTINGLGYEGKLFKGYTPSGTRRYVPATLENISKEMKSEGLQGASSSFGANATRARLLRRLRSLSEIKANRHLLDASAEEIAEEAKNAWADVVIRLAEMKEISDNPFINNDMAESRLQEAMVQREPIAYLNKEYGYSIPKDGDFEQAMNKAVDALKNLPSKYFETKFERPVYFDEFAAAVIPSDTEPDIKQALKDHGLKIFEYNPKSDDSRREATKKASELDGVSFSFIGLRGAEELDRVEKGHIRRGALDIANKMEADGKDAKAIKLATGWERGADGLWRYEIMDFKAYDPDGNIEFIKRNPGLARYRELNRKQNAHILAPEEHPEGLTPEEMTERENLSIVWARNPRDWDAAKNEWKSGYHNSHYLPDFVEYDELYKAYPALRKAVVKFIELDDNVGGFCDMNPYAIILNSKRRYNKIKAAEDIAHEIQHLIQHIEGFSQGTSLEAASRKASSVSALNKDENRLINDVHAWLCMTPEFRTNNPLPEFLTTWSKLYSDKWFDENIKGKSKDEIKLLWQELYLKKQEGLSAFDVYKRTSGEVEARNVSYRRELGMSEEMRRATLAEETEDVARKDQILNMPAWRLLDVSGLTPELRSVQQKFNKALGAKLPANDEFDGTMFSLSRNNRTTIEKWLDKREDLDKKSRTALIDYLDMMDNPRLQLATAKWFAQGTIRIPEDMPKVEQAVSVAGKAKVDPLQYSSPMELLDANADFKPTEKRINPDEVSTLHKAGEFKEEGIVIYDVDDSDESRQNMRQIINTHFGKEASPWCLLQGDGNGNLTETSRQYWGHYNSYPKQVAFKDGKLLAFSANDSKEKVWWDRQDKSHAGIPIEKKIEGDRLGRSATYIYNPETGQYGKPTNIHKGNQQNGTYELWDDSGEILLARIHFKDGKHHGTEERWYLETGSPWIIEEYRNGGYVGERLEWYPDGTLKSEFHFNDEGRLDGPMRFYWDNGRLQKDGNYLNGHWNGEVKSYSSAGVLVSLETYKNGRKNGPQETYSGYGGNLTGRVLFTNGVQDGLAEMWYNNGVKHKETTYKNGVITGVMKEWYRSGNMSVRTEFDEQGFIHGVREFYDDSPKPRVYQREHYNHGDRYGLWEMWYGNGNIQRRENFVDNKREGFLETFYDTGALQLRENYKHNERDGIREVFDRDGNLVERTYWSKGEKVRDLTPRSEDARDEGYSPYFSFVTDKKELEWLDKEPTITLYRAMAVVDGKLYPPMSTKEPNGPGERGKRLKLRPASEEGRWERADEAPEKAKQGEDGKWYFDLKKDNGESVDGVLYNPYFHTSASPLNDQFSGAYQRPNLVTVAVEVPISELDGKYKAEKAADSVGAKDWHSGTVTAQLGEGRQVVLSRWVKPVGIVSDAKVAAMIAPKLKKKGIAVPFNVVTPSLRAELEKQGVRIIGEDETNFSMVANSDKRGLPEEEYHKVIDSFLTAPSFDKSAYARTRFNLGASPAWMKEVGITGENFSLSFKTIKIHENKDEDHALTAAEWHSLPEAIKKPFLVTKFSDHENKYRLYTNILHNGKYVAVGIDVIPVNRGKDAPILEVNRVKTAFGINKGISKAEDVLAYDKEITPEQEALLRGLDYREYPTIQELSEGKGSDKSENSKVSWSKLSRTDALKAVDEKGLAGIIPENEVKGLRRSIYKIVPENVRRQIVEKAMANGLNFREGMDAYLENLAKGGTENDETGLLRALYNQIRDLSGNEDLTDADCRYIIWREGAGSHPLSFISEAAYKNRFGAGQEEPMFSMAKDFADVADSARELLDEKVGNAKDALEAAKAAAKAEAKEHPMKAVVKAMRDQKTYDKATVDAITKFAKDILRSGHMADILKQGTVNLTDINYLLNSIKNSEGKAPSYVAKHAENLLDKVLDLTLRYEDVKFREMLSVEDKKVNQQGVEVMGKLDRLGQETLKAVRDYMGRSKEDIEARRVEISDNLSSEDDALRKKAWAEQTGLDIAKQYQNLITDSKNEEYDLRKELEGFKDQKQAGEIDKKAYREFVSSTEQAIRENKLERVDNYRLLSNMLSRALKEGVESAAAFREAERNRIEGVHYDANRDMYGISAGIMNKESRIGSIVNRTIVRFFFKPLATFDQMLRLFARHNITGEGFLYRRMMGGWLGATERMYTNLREGYAELDAKVSEVFGKKMKWVDLYTLDKELPTVTVKMWDKEKMADIELGQSNLLYIYMVNKMTDGKMKLRRMGITEEVVKRIRENIDPRYIELADWVQGEFLPKHRNYYNAVHEKLFGAPMAAIEDYFPLKVARGDIHEDVDVAKESIDTAVSSDITAHIIKRKKNSLSLDIPNANAFDIVIEHLESMEKWAAFTPLRKDLNALLSYNHFRNQVMNMNTIYGSGAKLWKNFVDVCKIAAGTYRQKGEGTFLLNISKGVTSSKINFRLHTAMKQLLSYPAFWVDARIDELYHAAASPIDSWNWCMENLPVFRHRWEKRTIGDTRLMATDSDWKVWKKNFVKQASRLGMTPNAFVDAVTISIGAKAVYESKLRKYLADGFSQEDAERRAKNDATVIYNQSQQSDENAFIAAIQLDRTLEGAALSTFRNANMGYQRRVHHAYRTLGRLLSGKGEDFIVGAEKQYISEGMKPEQARQRAEGEYKKAAYKAVGEIAVYQFLLNFLWKIGPLGVAYLITGDDEDKKSKKLRDAALTTAITGFFEGLSLGGSLTDMTGNLVAGDKFPDWNFLNLPILQDVKNISKTLASRGIDSQSAYELVSLLAQGSIGLDPHILSDAVVAAIDAANGDMGTAKEIAFLLMRIAQFPQSGMKDYYVDEIRMTAREAGKKSAKELAKRYVRYKRFRKDPLSLFTNEDKTKAKADKTATKKLLNEALKSKK